MFRLRDASAPLTLSTTRYTSVATRAREVIVTSELGTTVIIRTRVRTKIPGQNWGTRDRDKTGDQGQNWGPGTELGTIVGTGDQGQN